MRSQGLDLRCLSSVLLVPPRRPSAPLALEADSTETVLELCGTGAGTATTQQVTYLGELSLTVRNQLIAGARPLVVDLQRGVQRWDRWQVFSVVGFSVSEIDEVVASGRRVHHVVSLADCQVQSSVRFEGATGGATRGNIAGRLPLHRGDIILVRGNGAATVAPLSRPCCPVVAGGVAP